MANSRMVRARSIALPVLTLSLALVFPGDPADAKKKNKAPQVQSAEDLQIVCVLILQLDEMRNLCLAGGTPGRPEIEEDYLPFERRQRHVGPVHVLQGEAEVGRRCVERTGLRGKAHELVLEGTTRLAANIKG